MFYLKYASYISCFWVLMIYKTFTYKPSTDSQKTKYEKHFADGICFKNHQNMMDEILTYDSSIYWLLTIGPALMTLGLIVIAISLPLGIIYENS